MQNGDTDILYLYQQYRYTEIGAKKWTCFAKQKNLSNYGPFFSSSLY